MRPKKRDISPNRVLFVTAVIFLAVAVGTYSSSATKLHATNQRKYFRLESGTLP
jgi:hypothetical protein